MDGRVNKRHRFLLGENSILTPTSAGVGVVAVGAERVTDGQEVAAAHGHMALPKLLAIALEAKALVAIPGAYSFLSCATVA